MIKIIKFKKKYQSVDWGSWKEVTDSYIISVLFALQKKYNFKILSCKLNGCFDWSKIVLWVKSKDYQNIMDDFNMCLSSQIENIRF